ncbi:serine/threonine-protein kinase [Nannocystis sp. SCPEA4]|uniref:serine/threonine protein kinase n=1 Tax=Nannocystis sp. SCPEA4 TaxID=2996787 RepID=UPI00226F26D0|nr:serine/threonine-protein kinase [Nannocystis sp. SCPEA4]MCY1062158.1 serine/threonine-protein kinase [Nannocystis sp. SCPEA4]
MRPDPKAWVGKTVGGVYRIERHVASGGFADVYQAWHEELETPVALKMRRPVEAKGSESQQLRNEDYAFAHFKTEAILGFRLRDPHVVRVLDFRLEAKAEYLVMEWLDGNSLRNVQDGRPMYWRRAAELTAAAADAVASLHASGWFHRDIKPDNFMVVGDGGQERVVLIDLGLVRHRPLEEPIMSQLADPTNFFIPCTPGYCAPEVFSLWGQPIAESPFTEASEVFALGCTLFKLLTDRLPWPGNTPHQQQAEIGAGTRPARPAEFGVRLPAELEQLVMRTLDSDPSRRPSSAAELAQQLRRLLMPSRPAEAAPTARAPEPTPPPAAVTGLRAPVVPSPALARSSATTARPPAVPPSPSSAPVAPVRGLRLGVGLLSASLLGSLILFVTFALQQRFGPLPTATTVQLQPELVHGPVPTRLPIVLPPSIPSTAPSSKEPATDAVIAPLAKASRSKRQQLEGEQLEEALRRCPSAPSGLVMFEIRGGQLQTIELEPFVATDAWHACAAKRLRGLKDGQHALRL